MKQRKLKKTTKVLFKSLLFCSPFVLLFSLPFLSLNSSKTLELPINSEEEFVLLYFGYPGCSKNCPDTLSKLSSSFQESKPKSLELVFINILKNNDDLMTERYVDAYYEHFRTQTLSKAQRHTLMNQFNIQEKEAAPNINHSNFLFLLKNEQKGQWALTKAFPNVESYIRYKNNGQAYEKTISKL